MKDPLVYLDDILESVRSIRAYVRDMSREEFLRDPKTQDAVVRRLEVMGEAANRLPQAFRDSHPEVPWRKIVGMRNVLAHEYDALVMDIVWDTIENHLDSLADGIGAILDQV